MKSETKTTSKKPKTKTKPKSAAILYDINAAQNVPLDIETDGAAARSVHSLKPLSNRRYFALELTLERIGFNENLTLPQQAAPTLRLYQELCTDAGENFDELEALEVIKALLFFLDLSRLPAEKAKEGTLYNPNLPNIYTFAALVSGVPVELHLSLKNPTLEILQAFREIQRQSKIKDKFQIVNAKSTAEKLFDLALPLVVGSKGYKRGSDVPAWHLIPCFLNLVNDCQSRISILPGNVFESATVGLREKMLRAATYGASSFTDSIQGKF